MKTKQTNSFQRFQKLVFHNLTLRQWKLFEELMGTRGGCGGCWCMSFRLSKKEFDANRYDGNKSKMKRIVGNRKPAGLIATLNGKPIGWIALAPREDFIKIENARTLKRIDNKPVWCIPCIFIRKEYPQVWSLKTFYQGSSRVRQE